jgi:hypothetical protein
LPTCHTPWLHSVANTHRRGQAGAGIRGWRERQPVAPDHAAPAQEGTVAGIDKWWHSICATCQNPCLTPCALAARVAAKEALVDLVERTGGNVDAVLRQLQAPHPQQPPAQRQTTVVCRRKHATP